MGEADTQADRRAAVCHTASGLREWELCEGINLVKWRAGWGGHPRQRDQLSESLEVRNGGSWQEKAR